MRIAGSPTFRVAAGLLLAVFLSVIGYHVLYKRNPDAPEALLKRADDMSWLNNWIAAAPLYKQAELQFTQEGQLSKALYARVSQMPALSESSTSFPDQIALLRRDLELPQAQEPETRLRCLTVLGMLEVNYDSGMARETWSEVQSRAISQHHYLLASRAIGEQGIAAFLLGDIATAKKRRTESLDDCESCRPSCSHSIRQLIWHRLGGIAQIQRSNRATRRSDSGCRQDAWRRVPNNRNQCEDRGARGPWRKQRGPGFSS